MMAFLRFLAGLFLLAAVIAGVYDGTRSMAAHVMVSTSLLEHWSYLAPASLAGTQNVIQRFMHPQLWEAGVRKLLLLPAWGLLGTLGLLFAFAGRRRRRVNVFAN